MLKKFILPLLLVIIILKISYTENKNEYALISLKGSVNPIVAEYITSAINKANKDNMSFVILTIDTPGGLISSMREIVTSILNSGIPVIVYTYPKGAQAASAGGFIMLAGDINAMAPGTEIGAMHPVSPLIDFSKDKNSQSKNIMAKKVLNDTVAYGRSLAQKHNRSVKWTVDAIKKASSSSYQEAQKAGVVDIIASDIPDLLIKIKNKKITKNNKNFILKTDKIKEKIYPMHWKENFLNFFADPQIVFFLFIIAVLGIGAEVKSPGLIFPGAIGGVSFFMFLMAIRILPINFAGLFLIILAIVLFILEINITSYGLLAIGGLVSFILGAMILFDSPLPGFTIPISTIIIAVLFILGIVYFVIKSIIDVHKSNVTTGQKGLIGLNGKVILDFIENTGKVMVHGEIWNANSEDLLKKNDQIEVISVSGMHLKIKKIKNK